MTDTDKLKRLAEELLADDDCPMLVPPQTILALIAENERLKAEWEGMDMYSAVVTKNYLQFLEERDEAVALLREWCSVGNPMERGHCHNKTDAFLARIDAKGPK